MPVVQDTFATDYAVGFAGQVANGETSNRISRTIEGAAGVGFGKAVFRGAGDHGVVVTPAANAFMGWTIADHGLAILPGGTADTYPQYANVPLLQRGSIWVVAGENLADGAAIGVTSAGAVVAVANVGAGGFALTGWVADMTVTSGALVRVTNNR